MGIDCAAVRDDYEGSCRVNPRVVKSSGGDEVRTRCNSSRRCIYTATGGLTQEIKGETGNVRLELCPRPHQANFIFSPVPRVWETSFGRLPRGKVSFILGFRSVTVMYETDKTDTTEETGAEEHTEDSKGDKVDARTEGCMTPGESRVHDRRGDRSYAEGMYRRTERGSAKFLETTL